MGAFSSLVKIIRGIKMSVESVLLLPFRDKADNLRNKSPEFRMFLDSDLGSPIETPTKKIWVDAMVGELRDVFPKGKISTAVANVWGNTIGDKAARIMDRKKLKDHYKKGRISVDEYAEKRATQIQANFINRLKRPIMSTRELMKQVGLGKALDKVDEFLKPAKDEIKKVLDPISDAVAKKSKNLMEKGIATFHKGIAEVRRIGGKIKEDVIKPVVEKTSKVIEKTVSAIEEFAEHPIDSVKKGFKKVWNWITGK